MTVDLLAGLWRRSVGGRAQPFSALADSELSLIVHFGFLAVLDRPAEREALEAFKGHLRNGMTLEEFWNVLSSSDEARNLSPVRSPEAPVGVCRPAEFRIMGTDRTLTKALWDSRVRELTPEMKGPQQIERTTPFQHSGCYEVSAIASIYKARRFIERLLENITSQTIFDRSELIIIDADSPENEADVIQPYLEKFDNIVYRRINFRIGIYDAWNLGVELARGKYLTNTNADDLRRVDSFEIQAKALEESGCDIAYQNFFYTLDPDLDFDQVARIGFVSDVPGVNAGNLIDFNSPHNAPMWRRDVHSDVGLFDTGFKSAGDWEFWLRCLTRNKSFHRIKTPHVVYYHNPDGISTRPNSRGIEESLWIRRRYRHLVTSSLVPAG